MGAALDFALNFADNMSGPAGKAAAALVVLEAALKGAGTASKQLEAGLKSVGALTAAAAKVESANAAAYAKVESERIKAIGSIERENAKGNAAYQLANQKNIAKLLTDSRKAADDLVKIEAQKNAKLVVDAQRSANLSSRWTTRDTGKTARVNTLVGVAKDFKAAFGTQDLVGGLQQKLLGIASSGPLASTGFGQFVSTVAEAAGPMGIVIAAAAALTAGVVALGAAMAKLALTSADEKRSLLLSLEGFTGSAKSAADLQDAIENVQKTTPASSDVIEQLGRHLAAAKIGGAQFEETLRSLAAVTSVVGDDAASKLQKVIDKSAALGKFQLESEALAGTGVTQNDVFGALAAQMHKSIPQVEALMKAGKVTAEEGIAALNSAIKNGKIGNVLERQMLALPTQIAKFKDSIGNLFDDTDIEPFLKGLHSVLDLFSDLNPSGQALKFVLTTIFSGLFEAASKVFPYVKAFMQGLIIAGLRLYIALKPIGKALASIFGGGEASTSTLELVAKFAEYAIYAAGAVAAFVALLVGPLVAAWGLLAAGAAAVVAGIVFMGETIWGVIQVVANFVGEMWNAGGSLIDGLVGGITAGAGRVVDAMKSLASSAIDSFKATFGIHSPSTVMGDMADHTVDGYTRGLDSRAPDAQEALSSMVRPDAPSAPRGGSGGSGMVFAPVLNFSGSVDRAAVEELIMPQLVTAFEQLQTQMGAGPLPA